MPRVNKLLPSIVILLQAVLALNQAHEDSIEFYFGNNEGSTTYSSSCHNFAAARQLYEVTISAFNKTEGFMQCFCSVRPTYATSNVTVRVVGGNNNIGYWLEDNSTIDFKLTYSDVISNGILYLQGANQAATISSDGVRITSDPQLPTLFSTMAISSSAFTPERERKDPQQIMNEHSHNAIYAIIGVIAILLLSLMTVLSITGRRKLVMLQNTINELYSSVGVVMTTKDTNPKPCSIPETPYEDVSNIDTNDRDATGNTASDKTTLPTMSTQNCNTEVDILTANANAKKKLNEQLTVNSQAVNSVDIRLYEPLDIYANVEADPLGNTADKYAQLSRTAQVR